MRFAWGVLCVAVGLLTADAGVVRAGEQPPQVDVALVLAVYGASNVAQKHVETRAAP